MIAFLMPVIVCITVVASVAVGVLAAYIAVFCVLSTFGRPPQPEPAPACPRLSLVPTEHHASGGD